MSIINLKVDKKDNGLRLDLYLSLNMNAYTRSFVKKCIEANQVKVNGFVEYKANYKVKEGDSIMVTADSPENNAENIKPEKIALKVLYEDEDLVVIDKPEGMVVHPATGNWTGTMMNALVYKYRGLKDVGLRVRSGLINRIDKDTSGIVLVGKNNKALWFYSRQFANRLVKKEYIAVVRGDFSKALKRQKTIEVTNYLGRNPKSRTKFAIVQPGKGKLASTVFSLIAVSKDAKCSLVKASIKTGRTHQIRVHLQSLNYPVLGDTIYGDVAAQKALHVPRLMLHAYSIELVLLNDKKLNIQSKIKNSFKEFIINNFAKDAIKSYIDVQDKGSKEKSVKKIKKK